MVILTVWIFFANQLNNSLAAHQRRLLDLSLSMRPSNDSLKKVLVVVVVAYFFISHMRNIQIMYSKNLISRLSMLPRSIVKRNEPEPRTYMYYERTILRLSASTFRSHFRLTKTTFSNLCNLLGPVMAPNVEASCPGRPNTPIEKQILPVLWLLATPECYRLIYMVTKLVVRLH